jgi:hypothetical protein
MAVYGRGSIAHVQYLGEENAAEVKKALEAVVSSVRREALP